MKAVVIIPTYNEKKNIKILIPRLLKVFSSISHDMHILVVDDNSPDKTAEEVISFQKRYDNIHLLQGEKQGLGIAYLRGFAYAVDKLHADVLVMMDADLSHPPELIPQFMQGIEQGYDLVIGSRYIDGGGTPDWRLHRKIISLFGNIFARLVGGMFRIRDCTSGFRAIKASSYKKVDHEVLHTRGYAFLTTLLFELLRSGAKHKEIPLVFNDRQHGKTKLQKKDMMEFFFNVCRLRFKTSDRMIKYGVVGLSGIFINMFFLWFFTEKAGIDYLFSSPLGVELSIIWNFFLNEFWTFKNNTNESGLPAKLVKFNLVAAGAFTINYIVLVGMTEIFELYYLLSNLIGIFVAFAWNYFMNISWTWRE